MKNYLAQINNYVWNHRTGPARVNIGLVLHFLAGLFLVCGIGQLICVAVSIGYNDGQAARFATLGLAELIIGGIAFYLTRPIGKNFLIRSRDVALTVTLVWLVAAILGALPLLASNIVQSPAQAFFEGMAGFTTGGATSLTEIDGLPESIFVWRTLTQWLGGIGIIVLFVGIAPAVGGFASKVLMTETPGMTKERITPRIIDTAKLILKVYLALTAGGVIAFYLAGMSLFDAINHSMTILATAGYSTHTDSIGFYNSALIEFIAICLMVAGCLNFVVYWRIATGRAVQRLMYLEIGVFFAALSVAIILVSSSLYLHVA